MACEHKNKAVTFSGRVICVDCNTFDIEDSKGTTRIKEIFKELEDSPY